MVNKAIIGVSFVIVKGSDFIISLDILVEEILVLEVFLHASNQEARMLATKVGVYYFLGFILAEVLGGVHSFIKPD